MNTSNTFSNVLACQRKGALLHELSAKLAEVVQSVRDTGKKGSLTLVLSVERVSESEGTVLLVDDVKAKIPQAPRPTSMFFVADDGTLTRTNPRQYEMELKAVEGGQAPEPLREAK